MPFLAKSGQTSVCFFLHWEGKKREALGNVFVEVSARNMSSQSQSPSGGTIVAKSREGCAGAFSSTPNALFHIKILCQNINLFQEMLHIHTFLSQHLTLQTQNAKIWIAITPEKMALMVSVG